LSALEEKGLRVTRGDRFFHLTANHNKGIAVKILLNLYREADPAVLSVGLGNSANDVPLLKEMDHAVVIRNPDGSWDPQAVTEIPWAQKSQGIGPEGWNESVLKVLKKIA
jgi:mannosyl-3-phosphoglycerate phosphatase